MTIYEMPVKTLLAKWARENLTPGQVFTKDDAVRWFAQRYPKIKGATIATHVDIMSINSRARKHHANIKPNSGHDLFYKIGPDEFRLWNLNNDPSPRYRDDFEERHVDGEKNNLVDNVPEVDEIFKVTNGGKSNSEKLSHNERSKLQDRLRIREVATKILALSRLFSPGQTRNDLDFTDAIVLVSCVKSKLPHSAPARALYTSAWFRKTRIIVERSGAKWFVLSSLYGLVAPDVEIAPYDFTLNTLGIAERHEWANKVLTKLLPETTNVKRVIMFAGYRYREFLVEPLERHGIKVEVPMDMLRRGEQLAWLLEH